MRTAGEEDGAAGSPQQEALLLGLGRGQRKGCGRLEGVAHATQQVVAVPGAQGALPPRRSAHPTKHENGLSFPTVAMMTPQHHAHRLVRDLPLRLLAIARGS